MKVLIIFPHKKEANVKISKDDYVSPKKCIMNSKWLCIVILSQPEKCFDLLGDMKYLNNDTPTFLSLWRKWANDG